MVVPFLLLLALGPAQAPAPEVKVLRFAGEGMSDATSAAIRTSLEDEIALVGGRPAHTEEKIDDACLAKAACRAGRIGDGAAGLDVQLFQVGPVVQSTVSLYRSDGQLVLTAERAIEAENVAASGVLGPEIVERLGKLLEAHTPSAALGEETPEEPAASEDDVGVKAEAEAGGIGRYVMLAGGGLAGATLVGALGALAVAALATQAAYSPPTPGDLKGVALVVAPVALGTAAVMVGFTLVGAGVGVAGLFIE